jgi:hypothetical protein
VSGGREIGLQAQNGTKEPPRNGPKTAKNSLPEQHHVEIRGFSATCLAPAVFDSAIYIPAAAKAETCFGLVRHD